MTENNDGKILGESPPSLGKLQGLMVLMGSIAHGLEEVLGRGATTITFRAGRGFGLRDGVSQKEPDLLKALQLVDQALLRRGIVWPFEPWKPVDASQLTYEKDGKLALKLVFRECMVRSALFCYGHEQKQSLCMMNHGLFCGYLQNILGQKADLHIVHAGEAACLKELVVG